MTHYIVFNTFVQDLVYSLVVDMSVQFGRGNVKVRDLVSYSGLQRREIYRQLEKLEKADYISISGGKITLQVQPPMKSINISPPSIPCYDGWLVSCKYSLRGWRGVKATDMWIAAYLGCYVSRVMECKNKYFSYIKSLHAAHLTTPPPRPHPLRPHPLQPP